MKLLFSISYYIPYISGISVYAERLAKLLSENHTCQVLCMRHEPTLKKTEVKDRVSIRRVSPTLFISKGVLAWGWIRASWQEVNKSDVVFIHLPQFEGWVTALFARILKKKIITIYHCDVNLPSGIFNFSVQMILDFARTD